MATKLVCAALSKIKQVSDESAGCLHFDLDPSVMKTSTSPLVAHHLEDLIQIACNLAIATSDQTELYCLQNIGLDLLLLLVKSFVNTNDLNKDKNQHFTEIFDDLMVSHILPSIKHALSSTGGIEDELIDSESAHLLFISGCELLQILITQGLANDVSSLKRLLKPVTPSEGDNNFIHVYFDDEGDIKRLKLKSTVQITKGQFFLRLGKFLTISELCLFNLTNQSSDAMSSFILDELDHLGGNVATNCASLAIDSFQLDKRDALCQSADSTPSIFTDNIVRSLMSKAWPALATFSLTTTLKALSKTDSDEEKESLFVWLDRIVMVLMTGFYDSLNQLTGSTIDNKLDTDKSKQTQKTFVSCLVALGELMNYSDANLVITTDHLWNLLCTLNENILFPLLGLPFVDLSNDTSSQDKEEDSTKLMSLFDYSDTKVIVLRSCQVFEGVAKHKFEFKDEERNLFMKSLLCPIVGIVEKKIDFNSSDKESKISILCSFIMSIQCVIVGATEHENIVKGLASFAISELDSIDNSLDGLKETLRNLLRFCLSSECIQEEEKLQYLQQTATVRNWDAWEVISLELKYTFPMVQCFNTIRDVLANFDDPDSQYAALSVISKLVSTGTKNDWIGPIMKSIGPNILNLLKYCGGSEVGSSQDKRVPICVMTVKIVMVTFQFMNSQEESEESDIVNYLCLIFHYLVTVIMYNGLPNQPRANPDADVSLGRVSAQCFVQIVRIAPGAFKTSMASLEAHDRAVVELAVRAEMSGYATPKAAPATSKVKLNFKAFTSAK